MWKRKKPETPRPQADPYLPRIRRIARSPLFDVEWYELQLGRTFPRRERAIRHYVRRGHSMASPHPLFEPEYLASQGFKPRRGQDPLSSYLADEEASESLSPHPLFDIDAASVAAGPRADRKGVVERWLENVDQDTPLPAASRWGDRAPTLGELSQAARNLVQEVVDQGQLDQAPRLHDSLEEAVSQADASLAAKARPTDSSTLVSVILPTYNRAGRLKAAIASVQAQTYTNWELLVVDDGSQDDTVHVLEGIIAFDQRVRLIRGTHAGVCSARNTGLREAAGELVAFLDSDNTWEPGYLAAMVPAIVSNGWDMAHAIQKVVDRDRESFRAHVGTRQHLLVANHVDLNVLMVRRQLLLEIDGFDESLRRAVDYDLILRLAGLAELHLVPVVGVVYANDDEDGDRISVRESHYWNDVVRNKHLVDWTAQAAEERTPGRVSVVVPMRAGAVNSLRWLEVLLGAPRQEHDLEVVLVGSGCELGAYRLVGGLVRALRAGKVLRTPRNVGWPVAVNLGMAASTGEYLAVVHPRAVPTRGVVAPLIAALAAGADFAQPLVLDREDLVASAGAGFADRCAVPYPLLHRHNVRDVPAGADIRIPAVLSPVFAARAAVASRCEGLDPLTAGAFSETELSMRAGRTTQTVSVLVPQVTVVERPHPHFGFEAEHAHAAERLRELHRRPPSGSREFWRHAGFAVVGHDAKALKAPARRPMAEWQPHPVRFAVPSDEAVPRLRWTIDIAAPTGPRGQQWGDLHFARSLAAALERRGQHVAIDFREARGRKTRALDDVVLVLRGLDEVTPRPGPVNLQWIISHPELVSEQECRRFDAVFAAATSWSKRMTDEWRMPIVPLLQCTDPERFHPGRRGEGRASDILFVGNSRKVVRPSVRAALNHGHQVDIYGADWEDYAPADRVLAESVANSEVGALYASAGVVLNDHWDDMREEGFISNRLFDAAACGARIISDPVEGIEDIFGGSVRTFRSEDELDRLLSGDRDEVFPDEPTRRAAAERIAREHSFDARAGQLLEHVMRLRGED